SSVLPSLLSHLSPSPFFFHPPPTPETYPLSLHDALPICRRNAPHSRESRRGSRRVPSAPPGSPYADASTPRLAAGGADGTRRDRSEEHTSELQSLTNLVCRLLLEKKKNQIIKYTRIMRHT